MGTGEGHVNRMLGSVHEFVLCWRRSASVKHHASHYKKKSACTTNRMGLSRRPLKTAYQHYCQHRKQKVCSDDDIPLPKSLTQTLQGRERDRCCGDDSDMYGGKVHGQSNEEKENTMETWQWEQKKNPRKWMMKKRNDNTVMIRRKGKNDETVMIRRKEKSTVMKNEWRKEWYKTLMAETKESVNSLTIGLR